MTSSRWAPSPIAPGSEYTRNSIVKPVTGAGSSSENSKHQEC